jgi:hypothetical protein
MKHQKIAPGLLNALLDIKERQTPALAVRARTLAVSHVTGSQKEPSIPVFLRCADQAEFSGLTTYGVRVNEPTGAVRTAYLPVSAIEQLSNHKGVRRISPSRKLRARLDVRAPGGAHPAVPHEERIPPASARSSASSTVGSIQTIRRLPDGFCASGTRRSPGRVSLKADSGSSSPAPR